jgi:hypothetical protein
LGRWLEVMTCSGAMSVYVVMNLNRCNYLEGTIMLDKNLSSSLYIYSSTPLLSPPLGALPLSPPRPARARCRHFIPRDPFAIGGTSTWVDLHLADLHLVDFPAKSRN